MDYQKVMWLLVVTALVGVVLAVDEDTVVDLTTVAPSLNEIEAPKNDEPTTEQLKKPSSYKFAFETENGQVRDESIHLNPQPAPAKMEVNVKGSYSFISADGYEYTVYYKADNKGYRPYVTAHKITAD